MAERSRRQSFRRSLCAAGLPVDALERLEAKRRLLDDSIHKYIAAKEREYQSFERDEIQRHRATPDTATSPPLHGQQQQQQQHHHHHHHHQQHGVDHSLAGRTDRRASVERDKDLIGVFTPSFLPALDDSRDEGRSADSAPPGADSPNHMQRAHSDPAPPNHMQLDPLRQAKQKRPIQLQLASRTSSSGSSAEGGSRLPSALKSPTHPRPKRKRVSLAVGDAIVAPSDNVPINLGSNNSTPSHSRTRSPASERDAVVKAATSISPPRDSPQQAEAMTAPFSPLARVTMSRDLPLRSSNAPGKQAGEGGMPWASPTVPPARPDVDGDLDFALNEDDMIPDGHASSQESRDRAEEIMGRIKSIDDTTYYPSEDMIDEGIEPDVHAEHMEFHPGSVQHTGTPGFRRPSVSADPVYMGRNYDQAEHHAVTNDIYGSSYVRPTKGSFTAGSLGESFMATNAARIMKDRRPGEHTQLRS